MTYGDELVKNGDFSYGITGNKYINLSENSLQYDPNFGWNLNNIYNLSYIIIDNIVENHYNETQMFNNFISIIEVQTSLYKLYQNINIYTEGLYRLTLNYSRDDFYINLNIKISIDSLVIGNIDTSNAFNWN